MNTPVLGGLINNAALLLALGVIYDVVARGQARHTRRRQVFMGVALGAVAIAVMITPWQFSEGVVFDTRSVLLSITGLYWGVLPAAIAGVAAAAFRLYQGGAGALTGTAVIITSVVLGITWRRIRAKHHTPPSFLELYIFGIVVHVAMLLWMFTLPWPTSSDVLSNISVPVLMVFPAGTALLGMLLSLQQIRHAGELATADSERRNRALIKHMTAGFALHELVFDDNGKPVDYRFLEVNPQFESLTGLKAEDLIGRTALEVFPQTERISINKLIEVAITGVPVRFSHFSQELNRHYEVQAYSPRKNQVAVVFNDVSERMRVESALRASEEKFRAVVEQSLTGIYVFQADRFIYVNARFAEMFGYKQEEVIASLLPTDVIAEEDRDMATRNIDRRLKGNINSIHYTARGKKKDGTRIWVEIHGTRIELDGVPTVTGTVLDITERVEAVSALEGSEARYRLIVETAEEGIWLIDADRQTIFVNPKMASILGYTVGEMVGAHIYKFMDDEGKELVQERLELRRQGVREQYDFRFKHKTGRDVWIRMSSSPIISEAGEYTGALSMATDITERKQAEISMRRYNQRLAILREVDKKILAAESVESVAETAAAGIRDLLQCKEAHVILFNEDLTHGTFLAVSSRDDVIGRPGETFQMKDASLLSRLDSNEAQQMSNLAQVDRSNSPFLKTQYEAGIRSIIAAPLIFQKNLIGVLTATSTEVGFFNEQHLEIGSELANQIAIAIGQLRLREKIRQHNIELEEHVRERTLQLETRNQEMETLTYSVSHDLKAPLRGIAGYTRILLEEYSDTLDDEGRKYLHTVRDATVQMGQLIEDLLSYFRLERRQITLKETDIQELARVVVADAAKAIADRNAQVKLDLEDVGTFVTDSDALARALSSILDNALKFTREIENPVITFTASRTATCLVLSVEDNGIGFDMKFHDRIFDVFQRLHRAEDYQGTGIGLAKVRKIVEILGGKVWAESRLGNGAIFHIQLPINHQTDSGHSA